MGFRQSTGGQLCGCQGARETHWKQMPWAELHRTFFDVSAPYFYLFRDTWRLWTGILQILCCDKWAIAEPSRSSFQTAIWLLVCKEIKPVNPKGNQSWIFIERTDAEAEAPVLWPPDANSQLDGKDPDAGKDGGQEEKGWQKTKWLNGLIDSIDYILCSQRWKSSIQSTKTRPGADCGSDHELSLLPNSDWNWRKWGKPLDHSGMT